MKNTATVFGILTVFFLIVGIAFKMQHWPAGGLVLTLALGPLHLLFHVFLIAYGVSLKDKNLFKITRLLGSLGAICYVLGVLFKIQHWPGSAIGSVFGQLILIFLFTPALIYSVTRMNSPFRQLNIRSILALCVFGLLWMGYLGLSRPGLVYIKNMLTLIDNEHRLLIDHRNSNEYLYARYEQLHIKQEDSTSKALWDKALVVKRSCKELLDYIESIKVEMIQLTEGNDSIKDIRFSTRPDNMDIPTIYMIGDDPNNPSGKAKELKEKIKEARTALLDLIPTEKRTTLKIGLTTEDVYSFTEERAVSWQEYNFYRYPLIGVIATLTQLQVRVKYAEHQVLALLLPTEAPVK